MVAEVANLETMLLGCFKNNKSAIFALLQKRKKRARSFKKTPIFLYVYWKLELKPDDLELVFNEVLTSTYGDSLIILLVPHDRCSKTTEIGIITSEVPKETNRQLEKVIKVLKKLVLPIVNLLQYVQKFSHLIEFQFARNHEQWDEDEAHFVYLCIICILQNFASIQK